MRGKRAKAYLVLYSQQSNLLVCISFRSHFYIRVKAAAVASRNPKLILYSVLSQYQDLLEYISFRFIAVLLCYVSVEMAAAVENGK